MKKTILFKLKFKEIMDAFWLREDILELIPNCKCEYMDNDFRCLNVSSETLFSVNELRPVFELYKTEFSILNKIPDQTGPTGLPVFHYSY